MKYNPLSFGRAKVAVVGVMALGAFTGAAFADTLPAPVQRSVSDAASNLGLSVPSGEASGIPLDATTTTPGIAAIPDETNLEHGALTDNHDSTQNDGANDNVDDSTQNDAANHNVDSGTQNDGANDNADDGAKDDTDDGPQNDGAQANADEGQQGNVDQGDQGDVSQGDGND